MYFFSVIFSDFEQKGGTVMTGDEGKTGRGRAKMLNCRFRSCLPNPEEYLLKEEILSLCKDWLHVTESFHFFSNGIVVSGSRLKLKARHQ